MVIGTAAFGGVVTIGYIVAAVILLDHADAC
jgi:hypothetical protein